MAFSSPQASDDFDILYRLEQPVFFVSYSLDSGLLLGRTLKSRVSGCFADQMECGVEGGPRVRA